MKPPPSRYKVVERGRRLEVIDLRDAASAQRPPVPPRIPLAKGAHRPTPAGPFAHRSFTTRPWFDDKGPRTITLDAEGEARLEKLMPFTAIGVVALGIAAFAFWPLSPALLFVLASKPTREKLRAAATRVIDRFART